MKWRKSKRNEGKQIRNYFRTRHDNIIREIYTSESVAGRVAVKKGFSRGFNNVTS